ncbi:MAG: ATP-grasp domain-containing protein [Ignavibacteriaceae bacterium]|nr:ATP-grasp domain-containing protein [Ignavibacteriaceae bacterium]
MAIEKPVTILAISSYHKGHDFLKEAKRQGARVLFLTSQSLQDAEWPRESIDEIYFMPDNKKEWYMPDVIKAVSFLARKEKLDKIVALDDFDVEKAASIREHLRIPGMGESQARFFRDKLAMRMRAKDAGIPVPEFIGVFNHDDLNKFASVVPFPFMVKPRMQAGSIGMKKVNSPMEMWDVINAAAEMQSFYLVERFIPGIVCHVDTIMYEGKVKFVVASEYGLPPLEVAHQGRVFTSRNVLRDTELESELFTLNEKVLSSLGLQTGVSHTEFIKAADGSLYFLETSARVGGAHISDLVEAATGVNLWAEWAKIESLPKGKKYSAPKSKKNYAALLNSLAKQQWPDMSGYNAPEVFLKMNREYHVGLILQSNKYEKISEYLETYTNRFYNDFFTFVPMADKPTN